MMAGEFIEAVKRGEIEGMSADPDNPALAYEPMDIYSQPGTKVRFTGYGGYESDQRRARELLEVDGIYTVDSINVGGWKSSVRFAEVEGWFNTVMFAREAA